MAEINGLIPAELLSLMAENRMPHAVALESSDKAALSKCADYVAAWAVCKSDNKPCGECAACRKLKGGNHPDVYTAKTEGKRNAVKISEIRNICADSVLMPNESDCKVYIIPEADKMEAAPQNAFLKLMEEPPQPMLFVLLCENTLGLLQTIRSRCSVFRLNTEGYDNEQAKALAEDIARAICRSKEASLVYACAALDDRQSALAALNALSEIIRAATAYGITGTLGGDKPLVRELSLSVKKRGLMNMQQSISSAADYIRKNVNLSLVGAQLAINLRYNKYM
ncbi:MAG: hypothetical protein ACI4F6_06870 [Acutalibacteraceae bacterium]